MSRDLMMQEGKVWTGTGKGSCCHVMVVLCHLFLPGGLLFLLRNGNCGVCGFAISNLSHAIFGEGLKCGRIFFTSTVNRRKKLIAGQLYFCPLEKFRWLKLDLVLANRPDLDVELMHVWQIRDSNCTPFRNSSLLSRSENKTSVPDNHMHKDKITFYLYPPPPLRFSSEGFSLHSAVLCCTSLHFSTQHLEGQRRWSHGID